ncbi:ShET2/EspL2 family type III secretion system effector toxin [Noviherbaspirillum cavernae]|uniref:ShET2/EspL2 family type III secretion system effector toxin n=1 Tax=Noviherbaspirillum cavernae TaxID=2320862 RepID=UPI0013150016|nr:ShET2/EspL2 family type III secretion system effector toxin [Noviherbaspirillum cavernae]
MLRPGTAFGAGDRGSSPDTLEHAIQRNDVVLVKALLANGADVSGVWDRVKHLLARPEFKAIQDALTYDRRLKILYPEGASQQHSALDNALHGGRLEQAKAIMEREISTAGGIDRLWARAAASGQRDILRALLLLGYAERSCTYRRFEKTSIDDAGIRTVMKEIPYISPRFGGRINLNGKARFRGTDEEIDCSPIAMQYMKDAKPVGDKGRVKPDYTHLASKDAIEAGITPDIRIEHERLKAHATDTHLIPNGQFGAFLVGQFQKMELLGEEGRQMLMESPNHSMSLELAIKKKDGVTSYVVRFFDPNDSVRHVRAASSSARTFEFHDVGAYVAESRLMKGYYPHEEKLSMLYVRPRDGIPANAPHIANRTLTSCVPDAAIGPWAMHCLLENGFAGNILQLEETFVRMSEEEQVALLSSMDEDGTPGLFSASKGGHADAIRAFGRLLSHVPESRRASLVAAIQENGISGLAVALFMGHANVIHAYGELLSLIPDDKKVELVMATVGGMPALHAAMAEGHGDAIAEYGPLLSEVRRIAPGKLMDILEAKESDGISAFGAVMEKENPNVEVACRYLQLVKDCCGALEPDERTRLRTLVESSCFVETDGVRRPSERFARMREESPAFARLFDEVLNKLSVQ